MAASSPTDVRLIVGGIELYKWQSFAIESDILTPADAFNFRAPNRNGELAGIINPGDRVEVSVDSEVQMVGYVDEVGYDCDANESAVDITGRDLFQFLVDCSAPAISLHSLTLQTLAEKLTSEWIDEWQVTSNVALPSIKKMKIEPGDNPLEVIQRFAQQAQMTVWLSADGKGIIGKPNYTQAPSYYLYRYPGSNDNRKMNNIIRGRVTNTWKDQFSTVTVGGSVANSDKVFGSGSSKFKARAIDSTIKINKPKNISSGNVANTKQAKILADEEVQKGRFESQILEYTVKGFYNNNALWQIDKACAIEDTVAGVSGVYYVTRRRFYNDGEGDFTDVSLRKSGVWLA